MSEAAMTLTQLRDLHFELALKFETYAHTTDDGAEVHLLLDKREEAWAGTLYFQGLIDSGTSVVPTRLAEAS